MKILYIPNGGFGDASWSTSWPRIFSEKGHEIDVLLMRHTGNPFHANPFIRNMFIEDKMKTAEKVVSVIAEHSYDYVLIPNTTCGGVTDVIEATKDLKHIVIFNNSSKEQIKDGIEIPPLTKPEWYYEDRELKYIKDLNIYSDTVLFHPLSSCTYEKSRNLNYSLIADCVKKLRHVVVTYGGRKYLPIDDIKKMTASGAHLLWEDLNCFHDKSGSALGKFLALTSQCKVGVHAWSGSMNMSMGFNKPYVVVVPGDSIRGNGGAPYKDTKMLYEQSIRRADTYGCLNPSAWCVTENPEIVLEAIEHVLLGKTCLFNKSWKFI